MLTPSFIPVLPQNVDQTDVLAVLGETSLPSRYNYDGSSNANWHNGIDATVFMIMKETYGWFMVPCPVESIS